MIPSFRKGILESEYTGEEAKEGALHHLRLLFGRLRESRRESDASQLCEAVRDREGNSLPKYKEFDPGELFSLLVEQLAGELGSTNNSKLIDEVFRGSVSSEVVCKDCPHRYEVKEDFISLGFQIENKKSLIEALNDYTKTEALPSKSYYCTRCNANVSAKARTSFSALPNVLIISLKAFPHSLQAKYAPSSPLVQMRSTSQ